MRRPNLVSGNLRDAEAVALRAYRRTLTVCNVAASVQSSNNAASPKRARKADLREAATVLVETMRDVARDGGAA